MNKQLVVLCCGGGSLGHLMPCIAVAQEIERRVSSANIVFVCAKRDDERALLTATKRPFVALPTPRLSHRLSIDWLMLPIRLVCALLGSWSAMQRWKPDIVFSKGGSLSVAVCLIAKMKGIPVVLHESDAVMGRANRFIAKMATTVCVGFPAIHYAPSTIHFVHTGNPVRSEIAHGSRDAGTRITGFSGKRPVLMIIGGSQGSQALNDAIVQHFNDLLSDCDLIHITGKGKENAALQHARYWQRELVVEELPNLYALADIVLTRAGAGALSELAMLSKPSIVVPLRGVAQEHQVRNAKALADLKAVTLLEQENLGALPSVVRQLLGDEKRRHALGAALHEALPANAHECIATAVLDACAMGR